MKKYLYTLFFCFIALVAFAQDWSLERSVQITADIQESPAMITLNWISQPVNGFTLYKRMKGDTNWGSPLANLSGTTLTYEDSDVTVGESYEYRIEKIASIGGAGAINAGIKIPAVHNRGRLILVVDETHAAALTDEITRLILDIEGDGWAVTKIEVNPADAVTEVKSDILSAYGEDPTNTKSVLLLGHIPVPYSGSINYFPDGHADHEGAWPADLYYGELNGTWTDQSQNITSATDPRNHNVPGDGKFDQAIIPSNIELQVGRIDFANLPAFSETETELLKKYLDKNHAFRHKEFTATPRGLIDNNFGGIPEGFGQNGYRNFSAMFGSDQIDVLDFSTLKTESYLWSYAAGGGSYTSANDIITTAEFAADSIQSVFSMLFGSYFGDWDSQNNLLRSALASGTVLTNAWAGRPKFQFEHMALGENIGYGLPLTQNTATNYVQDTCFGGRLVHVSFMGDPTLRMHIVEPIPSLTITEDEGDVILNWTASSDADLGYNVYRKEQGDTNYELINTEPETGLTYTFECADLDVEYVYMIRALRLETSASGSYYNMSQGIADNYTLAVACVSAVSEIEALKISLSPMPARDFLQIELTTPLKEEFQLQLMNANGQTVLERNIKTERKITLPTTNMPAGVYLLMIRNKAGEISSKKVIIQ